MQHIAWNELMAQDTSFDIAIAGAGIAGLLCASRLAQSVPKQLKILLLEKQAQPGGRLGAALTNKNNVGVGICAIGERLYEFIRSTLSFDPDSKDLSALLGASSPRLGVLNKGKMTEFPLHHLYSLEVARSIERTVTNADWQRVTDLFFSELEEEKDQVFEKVGKFKAKSPALAALSSLGALSGVLDHQRASLFSLREREQYIRGLRYQGPWAELWEQMLTMLAQKHEVTMHMECSIYSASYQEEKWQIATAKGEFDAKTLVVAQASQDALRWLDEKEMPSFILDQAFKSQPCSILTLFQNRNPEIDIPEVVLVPGEDSYATSYRPESICYQIPLAYEQSLDAPSVVKALKKLKRTRARIEKAFPGLAMPDALEHVGLHPVGFVGAIPYQERRNSGEYDIAKLQKERLVFCGDSYGVSCSPESNLIRSVNSACEVLSGAWG